MTLSSQAESCNTHIIALDLEHARFAVRVRPGFGRAGRELVEQLGSEVGAATVASNRNAGRQRDRWKSTEVDARTHAGRDVDGGAFVWIVTRGYNDAAPTYARRTWDGSTRSGAGVYERYATS